MAKILRFPHIFRVILKILSEHINRKMQLEGRSHNTIWFSKFFIKTYTIPLCLK